MLPMWSARLSYACVCCRRCIGSVCVRRCVACGDHLPMMNRYVLKKDGSVRERTMSSSRHALNLDPTRAAHLPLCPWLPLPGCEAALAHSLSEEASFDSPCSCAALRCPSPGFDARRSRPLSTALRLHCQLWASVRYRGGNKVEAAGGFPARSVEVST